VTCRRDSISAGSSGRSIAAPPGALPYDAFAQAREATPRLTSLSSK